MAHTTEPEITVEGNDLEDALAAASERLGIGRNDLEYRVIDSDVGGIFGIFKKKKITITAWHKDGGRPLLAADQFLLGILSRMGIDARVTVRETDEGITLNAWTDDPRIVEATSEAIREADPDAILISAGLAPTGQHNELAHRDDMYLQAMYNVGFEQYIDVVGVHAPGFSIPAYGPDDAEKDHRTEFACRGVDGACFERAHDDLPCTALVVTGRANLRAHRATSRPAALST